MPKSRVVAYSLLYSLLVSVGWLARAHAEPQPIDWTYDPDPAIEAIFQQAQAVRAEVAVVDREARRLQLLQIPIEVRRHRADTELRLARIEHERSRAYMEAMRALLPAGVK